MFRLIVLCFLILGCATAQAQVDDEFFEDEKIENNTVVNNKQDKIKERKPFKPDNIFVGTTFSAMFGTYMYFDVSPYGGYILGKVVGVGLGGTYIYSSIITTGGVRNETNIYGGRLFANLRPFHKIRGLKGLYAHVEGEYLNRASGVIQSGRPLREWLPAVNVGLGYNTKFDKGFAFTAELLFNTLWIPQAKNGIQPVFTNPWQYRIGVYYAF